MKDQKFAVALLSFCLMFTALFAEMRAYFNKEPYFQYENQRLAAELDREVLRHEVTLSQLLELQQETAAVLPPLRPKDWQHPRWYPARRLASVTQQQSLGALAPMLAQQVFDQGRQAYNRQDYASAIGAFEQLLEGYPFSVHLAEAHMLLSECYYQTGQTERFVTIVKRMVRLFPEDELSGHSLVRLGQVLETQDRLQEAVHLYKTVIQSFADQAVRKKAKLALQSVRL